jgi:hypothetical protein
MKTMKELKLFICKKKVSKQIKFLWSSNLSIFIQLSAPGFSTMMANLFAMRSFKTVRIFFTALPWPLHHWSRLFGSWGPKFFFHNMDFMGIKRRRILCRFQKYKLISVTNAPKKSNPRIKISVCTQGATCVVMKIFILELLFLGAFCH